MGCVRTGRNIVESLDGITIVPLCGNLEKELHKVPLLDVVDLSVMSVDKIKLLQGKLKPGARNMPNGPVPRPLKKGEGDLCGPSEGVGRGVHSNKV